MRHVKDIEGQFQAWDQMEKHSEGALNLKPFSISKPDKVFSVLLQKSSLLMSKPAPRGSEREREREGELNWEWKRERLSLGDADLLSSPLPPLHPAVQRDEEQWLHSALGFQSRKETAKCFRAGVGRWRDCGGGGVRKYDRKENCWWRLRGRTSLKLFHVLWVWWRLNECTELLWYRPTPRKQTPPQRFFCQQKGSNEVLYYLKSQSY